MNQDFAFETDSVRQLRTAKGVSMEVLARHCALSIRQLRQIEEGGHDAFYTPSIKQLAQRKVLQALQDAEALSAMERLVEAPLPRPAVQRHFALEAFRPTRPVIGN